MDTVRVIFMFYHLLFYLLLLLMILIIIIFLDDENDSQVGERVKYVEEQMGKHQPFFASNGR